MFIFEIIKLGLNNLRLHMLRSFLTALGIIFGVTSVIVMVSIGEGSKQAALEQIERLGARNIIIRSVKPVETAERQQGSRQGFQAAYGITRVDLEAIEELFPNAEQIVPVKAVGQQVVRGPRRKTSQAYGTTPALKDVANIRVKRGRYLTQDDLDSFAEVAVIGDALARTFFPFEDPLGNTIRIDQQVFTVVGVLSPVGLAGGAGAALVGRDLNEDMHIPITTAKARFGDTIVRRASGSFSIEEVEISELYYTADSRQTVLQDAEGLKRLMSVKHPQLKDIELIVPYELLEEAKRVALTWQIVLGSIAGISLLVGGIGIMNIMLASVTERTREIGIRRALGATRQNIVTQFIVETGVLSAIGGIVGVVLGIAISLAFGIIAAWLAMDNELATSVTTWSILLSFFVATGTGLIFGIYPAIVASRQDPIVALRHD
jgi:putative ABC transport system permease protein